MIGRSTWRKGLAVLLLVAAAALFYAMTAGPEPAGPVDGRIVFTNQYMPAAGGVLRPAGGDGATAGRSGAAAGEGGGATAAAGDAASTAGGAPAAGASGETGPGDEGDVAVLPAVADGAGRALERVRAFDRYRAGRLQERARRLEQLETLLADPALSASMRERVQEEILALMARTEVEERAEGLLVARGLYDAVVVVGPRSADVIVSEQLTRDQAGQIGSVVARVAGVPLDNITIVDGAPAD